MDDLVRTTCVLMKEPSNLWSIILQPDASLSFGPCWGCLQTKGFSHLIAPSRNPCVPESSEAQDFAETSDEAESLRCFGSSQEIIASFLREGRGRLYRYLLFEMFQHSSSNDPVDS